MSITIVQFAVINAASGSFSSNTVAGNTLICFTRGTSQPTDLINGAWLQTTASALSSIWYVPNAQQLLSSSVISFPSNSLETVIMEVSGLSVSPLDVVNFANGVSAAYNAGSITTNYPVELLTTVVANGTANGLTDTPAGGFVDLANANGNCFAATRIVASTGTYSNPGTLSSSVSWGACVVGFIGTGQQTFAPGTYLQGTNQLTDTSGTTTTLAFQSPTLAGSMLFATFQMYNLVALNSITDSQGNTWVVLNGPTQVGAGPYRVFTAYALNTIGGTADVVTFHWASATSIFSGALGEYAHINAIRGSSFTQASGFGNISGIAITTVAGDLVISTLQAQSGDAFNTFAPGTTPLAFTLRNYYGELISRTYGAFEDTVATGTSSNGNWATVGADNFLLGTIAFYEAASGAAQGPSLMQFGLGM